MKTFWIVIAAIIVIGAVWFVTMKDTGNNVSGLYQESTSTPQSTVSTTTGGTSTTTDRHVTPDGLVFVRPTDFALAVTPEQVTVKSVIPPCEQGFKYCLYYIGNAYAGANFESAGIGISTLTATSSTACTAANDYNGPASNARQETIGNKEFFVFESGDAGAGHMAEDTIYRGLVNGTCFQFVARIGQSQFLNYEPGAIKEFTDAMQAELRSKLDGIVNTFTFQS